MATQTETAVETKLELTPPDPVPVVAPARAQGLVPVDTDNACTVLDDFASGRIAPPTRHYHQYLHASTTAAV